MSYAIVDRGEDRQECRSHHTGSSPRRVAGAAASSVARTRNLSERFLAPANTAEARNDNGAGHPAPRSGLPVDVELPRGLQWRG